MDAEILIEQGSSYGFHDWMRAWKLLFRLCDELMIFGEGFFIHVQALLAGFSTRLFTL